MFLRLLRWPQKSKFCGTEFFVNRFTIYLCRVKMNSARRQKSQVTPTTSTNQGTTVMKYKCTFSGTVNDVFKRRGWISVEEGSENWDIFFCDMMQMKDLFAPGRSLQDQQRVGHFRNNYEISRKNFMVRNLKRLKSRIEKSFGREEGKTCAFFPTTFILPLEEKWFLQEFRLKPSCFWIIKPAAGAQGRGIFIFRSIKDYYDWRGRIEVKPPNPLSQPVPAAQPGNVSNAEQTSYLLARLQITPEVFKLEDPATSEFSTGDNVVNPERDTTSRPSTAAEADLLNPTEVNKMEGNKNDIYVIQQYIANPYLIGGRKEGFARFSQGQYSLESLQDVYIHLTNVAIQRTAEDYNPEMGSKWSIGNLRQYMTARHGYIAVQKMMNQIDNIVVRTLQSVHQLIISDRHCFEIYGFDVLIDDTLEPWLLEVNCSPSFTPSNEEDYRLKCALIDDTVHVLDLEERLSGYEKRVGGFDLIWDSGPVYGVPGDCGHSAGCGDGPKLNSFLGCHNDRTTQLRTIFTNAQFVREVHKVNAQPNEVTIVGPGARTGPMSSSYAKDTVDERFRMPTMTPTTTMHQSTATRGVAPAPNSIESHSPLIVLGKSVQFKRNLTTLVNRFANGENYSGQRLF